MTQPDQNENQDENLTSTDYTDLHRLLKLNCLGNTTFHAFALGNSCS